MISYLNMAWWLAYEELYGDMDEEYPIMTGISTDTTIYGGGGEDTISFQGAADWNYSDSYWESDFGDTITCLLYTSPSPRDRG